MSRSSSGCHDSVYVQMVVMGGTQKHYTTQHGKAKVLVIVFNKENNTQTNQSNTY